MRFYCAYEMLWDIFECFLRNIHVRKLIWGVAWRDALKNTPKIYRLMKMMHAARNAPARLPPQHRQKKKPSQKKKSKLSQICVVMTVFRMGAFGFVLVVTTSDETSHGDTISASSIFDVPLLF